MKPWGITTISEDGIQDYDFFIDEEKFDSEGLWHNCECICFENDYKKQNCRVLKYEWVHGNTQGWELIDTFKGEVLGEWEMGKYIEEHHKTATAT